MSLSHGIIGSLSRVCNTIFTLTGREDGAKADPRQGRAAIATMEAIFMMLVVKM
jgi:hypothetical protein